MKKESSIDTVEKELKPLEVDWEKYFVLMPQGSRYCEKKVTVDEKGTIRLNKPLQKEILSKKIEFIFSKDCREIILNENGQHAHTLTKAGTAKNNEIVKMLKKIRVSFPVVYYMEWDEKVKRWKGAVRVPSKK